MEILRRRVTVFGMAHRHASAADLLAQLPAFAGFSRHELQKLLRRAAEIDVEAGKVLTREGEPGREFLIVLAGTAVATREGEVLAHFGPGDTFGEIAVLDRSTRTATVTAETPMRVAVVAANDFQSLMDEVPTLAHAVMQTMAHRLSDRQ
jgi:CRP-like cAMP-binding protein